MAHFAELDTNNIVKRVLVVNDDYLKDENDNEVEALGRAHMEQVHGGKWVQTSYNNNIRKRYAGIGYQYHEELDAFILPSPFPSWVLIEETADWESPVGPAPELTEAQVESRSFYKWDEENLEWVLETPAPE